MKLCLLRGLSVLMLILSAGRSVGAEHDFARWEKDMAVFERSDATNPPPAGAVVFIGSSTIARWKTLAQDFPGQPVLNRGFGGSEIVDATHFAARVIFPYSPRMIVLRSGGNDLWAGKSPAQVFADFREFTATVHAQLPATEIIFLSLSPSPSRWRQHESEQEANRLVQQFAARTLRVKYLEAYDVPVGAEGRPRPELFVADQLHFNAEGYRLLAERVRPIFAGERPEKTRAPARLTTSGRSGRLIDITDENDAWSNFFGPHQDRHYTHGFKVTYLGPEHALTNGVAWWQRLATWGIEPATAHWGMVFGQSMFTPENILDPKPIATDRPYAGWLYTGLVYQRHSEPAANVAVMDNFELNVGLVGPDSYADDAQKIIHRWRFPEDIPEGWDNQLHDEPGLVLKYARLWRLSPTPGTARYFDVIPRAGIELGNVAIFGTVGATARLGFNLPDDFGVQFIDSPSSVSGRVARRAGGFSLYLFAGVDGRAVGHDLTLDGNSFRGSARVDKYNFVNDLSWGIALQPCRYLSLSYAQITRSKQFRGQRDKDAFGSLDVKVLFGF